MSNEDFLKYATEKIVFNVMAANDYAKRGNLYQAGLKSGAVITLIGCLNQMGFNSDCECDTAINGVMTFTSVVVDGKKIFDRSARSGGLFK